MCGIYLYLLVSRVCAVWHSPNSIGLLHAIVVCCLWDGSSQYVVGVDMIYAKLKQLEIASFAAKYSFNRLLIALILLLPLLLSWFTFEKCEAINRAVLIVININGFRLSSARKNLLKYICNYFWVTPKWKFYLAAIILNKF